MARHRLKSRPLVAFFLVAALVLSSCGGGGGGSSSGEGAAAGGVAPDGPVVVGLQPAVDGWSFPNFPSSSYPDANFGVTDIVSMFGSGETICVGGVAEPCELTAEAAAWARMVNQARASGHCEGLVVLASSRYNNKETPQTVNLPTVDETLSAIMRAFATQFIPEVQQSINTWMAASLEEKIAELKRSMATGKLEYTLGVYVAEGGHAVLPYAVEYPSADVARIMVYDSNWPAKNRYVDVDLAAQTWTFSFSGEDPATDPAPWTGGPADMDLTPFSAREGTCPFCGADVKVAKTTLLIRSTNLEWEVASGDQVVTPETGVDPDGASAQPVKGISITSTDPQQTGGRSSYDYLVQIPNELLDEFLASQESTTTTAAAQGGVNLRFTGPSSVFALTPTGIAEVKTTGESSEPINVTRNSIRTKDPNANITLAAENLVANASGSQVELQTSETGMEVTVTAPNGQVITQNVTPEQPVVQMVADPTSGGITVLAQSSTGEVQKTEVAPDGSQTTETVDPNTLNLNSTEVQLPAGLESKPNPALPPLENRNLANPDYQPDAPYVAPTTVPTQTQSTTAGNQVAAAPTTTAPGRGVNASANTAPAATGTPVRPQLGTFRIPSKTFGDAAFTVDPPDSDSMGGFRFTSSNVDVATVNQLTGRVTIAGAGTTTITATQSAVAGFTTATATATLTVGKARPNITKPTVLARTFGDDAFTLTAPKSTSAGVFLYESSDENVARVNRATGRVTIAGAGRTTITMSQVATDNHLAASTEVVLNVRKATPTLTVAASEIGKLFGDADFDLTAPSSSSTGAITFTSSDSNVVSVTSVGRASIKGVGAATITASQAATDNHLEISTTFTIRVSRAGAQLSGFADVTKTFGDAKFTMPTPKSAGTGAFAYASDNDNVATIDASSGEVTIVGAGTATITATQAASTSHEGGTITARITVQKAAPSITNVDPGSVTYDQQFTLAPVSNSSGAFSFSTDRPDVFQVNADTGVVRALTVDTATLTVRQAATSNYEAASKSIMVTVDKAAPTLTNFVIPMKAVGDPMFELTPPTSTRTPAQFTYEVVAPSAPNAPASVQPVVVSADGSVYIAGPGTVQVRATQAGNNLYTAATIDAVLTVAEPSLAGTFVEIAEFQSQTITAPAGHVITKVLFASYGLPTGSSGDYTIGSCHAATSMAKVEEAVLGRSSATLTADNAVFGDPCTGPTKRLYVRVAFGKSVIGAGLLGHLDAGNRVSFSGGGTTWRDLSGNGRNAALLGPSFDSNGYMAFDGVDDFANWGRPLQTGTNYTIEAWVWRDSTKNTHNIVSTNVAPLWFQGSQLKAGLAGDYDIVLATDNSVDRWVHVAVTFDDVNDTMRLYRDGVLVSTGTTSLSLAGQLLTIGSQNNDNDTPTARNFLKGRIAQVRLYDTALPATAISHNRIVSAPVVASSMVSHLDARNPASFGSVAGAWTDVSGNGKSATLQGGLVHNAAGYMVFDGSSAYGDWGQPLESNSSYTIEGWIWRDVATGARNIASTSDAPFWFNGSTYAAGVAAQYTETSLANVSTTGQWMHVAVTFDDPGQGVNKVMSLYLNGVRVNEKTTVLGRFVKQWLTIGSHNNTSTAVSFFDGRISQMRLYNRALSAAEVEQNRTVTLMP